MARDDKQTASIMIVDDDPGSLKLEADVLSSRGYSIIKAQDGSEALDLIKQKRPDLIVLDLVMPKSDGWRVCKKLKEDPAYKSIPIILMSVLIEQECETQALELGDAFLTKPFDTEKFLSTVRRLLSQGGEGRA